jgi:hypothetical protein
VQERPRNRRQGDRAGDADPRLGEAAVEEAAKHYLFHHRRRNRHRDDMDEQAAGRASAVEAMRIDALADVELQRMRERDQERQRHAGQTEEHIASARADQSQIRDDAPSRALARKDEDSDQHDTAQDQHRRPDRVTIPKQELVVGQALVPPHQAAGDGNRHQRADSQRQQGPAERGPDAPRAGLAGRAAIRGRRSGRAPIGHCLASARAEADALRAAVAWRGVKFTGLPSDRTDPRSFGSRWRGR